MTTDPLRLEGEGGADLGSLSWGESLLGLAGRAELEGVDGETERGLDARSEGLGVAEGEETGAVDLGLCGGLSRKTSRAGELSVPDFIARLHARIRRQSATAANTMLQAMRILISPLATY